VGGPSKRNKHSNRALPTPSISQQSCQPGPPPGAASSSQRHNGLPPRLVSAGEAPAAVSPADTSGGCGCGSSKCGYGGLLSPKGAPVPGWQLDALTPRMRPCRAASLNALEENQGMEVRPAQARGTTRRPELDHPSDLNTHKQRGKCPSVTPWLITAPMSQEHSRSQKTPPLRRSNPSQRTERHEWSHQC